nr:hypothetical protein [uncultured Cellulosilyticum sp.]
MSKHNFVETFNNINGGDFANYTDLHYLLDKSKELDLSISEAFPIDSTKISVNVKGSKELLLAQRNIDDKTCKLDIQSALSNVSFLGLTASNQIKLALNSNDDIDPVICTSMYKSSNQFYDIFKMSTFADYLISNSLKEKIKPNIDYLISNASNTEKQFRLLLINNEYFLRGLTSPRYKNYDNSIIIYVILYLLDKLNTENNTSFQITKFYLTDSDIRLFINQSTPSEIPNVGLIYFGLLISNNEITDGKVDIELRYHFYDPSKQTSFGCIPKIEDAFIQIQHTSSIKNAISKFLSFNNIINQNNIMIEYIDSLSKIKVLTDDIAYSLLRKITTSKAPYISKSIKKSFKNLYDTRLVKNTYSIIEALDIVTNLATNIDEKIALERIYYELIKEITAH